MPPETRPKGGGGVGYRYFLASHPRRRHRPRCGCSSGTCQGRPGRGRSGRSVRAGSGGKPNGGPCNHGHRRRISRSGHCRRGYGHCLVQYENSHFIFHLFAGSRRAGLPVALLGRTWAAFCSCTIGNGEMLPCRNHISVSGRYPQPVNKPLHFEWFGETGRETHIKTSNFPCFGGF